jgi:hypothetical protein
MEDSNRNFTLSNKSGLTFEESSQSIAQELRNNESIASGFGANGNFMGSTLIPGPMNTSGGGGGGVLGNSIMNMKQTSIINNGGAI